MKRLIFLLALGCMTEVSGFQAMEDAATMRRLPGAPMVEADAGVDVKEQDSRVPGDSGGEMPGGSDIGSFSPETMRDHSVPDASPDIGVSVDGPIVSRDGPIVSPDAVILPPDATPAPDTTPDTLPPDTTPACPVGARGRCERFPEIACSSDRDCGVCSVPHPTRKHCAWIGGTPDACTFCSNESTGEVCLSPLGQMRSCGAGTCTIVPSCEPSRCIPCGGS